MRAKIHVEGYVYCEIKIENTDVPPSKNLVDRISIYEGFGTFPTLEMYLLDQSRTLQADLKLTDGTVIKIKYAQTGELAVERRFRCWHWKKEEMSEGPMLKITAILNKPLWSAAARSESFPNSTSSEVMEKIASDSGLEYDGDDTSDAMTWLNLNKTRNAFSEDVAMRGFNNDQSCMARIVTMEEKLRYKDMLKEIANPKLKFLLDVGDSEEGVTVTEGKTFSSSSLIATWMNYGWKHHYHDLSGNQKSLVSVDAPLLGDSLPINSEVASEISTARITYSGMDTGTAPSIAPNVHEHYEKSLYQNLRFLGLFTERLRILIRDVCEAQTLDGVEFKQAILEGSEYRVSKETSGNYIISGKSVHIKHGHWYYETYDLIRPYVNMGQKQMGSPKQNKTNDGSIPIPDSRKPENAPTSQFNSDYKSKISSAATGIQSAIAIVEALNAFNSLNPKVPNEKTSTADALQNQEKIRESIKSLKRSPLGTFDANVTEQEVKESQTLTKVEPDEVQAFLNSQ